MGASRMDAGNMLRNRLIVANIIIPAIALLIILGGLPYTIAITAALAVAAWEFCNIFQKGGYFPSRWVLIGGVILLTLRSYLPPVGSELLVSFLILLAMTIHVIDYEKGIKQAAVGFCITLAGIFYLGWLGGYLVALRNLSDGLWWAMLVFPAVWLADLGAYLIGSRFGKHLMTPLVSPRKTWEGYAAGVLFGGLGTALVASLWHIRVDHITFIEGLVIGLAVGILTPLGDVGESMLKRQFDLKDSSNILPGHGGALDRLDSWIWSGVIGYYLIIFLWS
jgi:phosphatidate cytidylyltransferase